MNTTAIVIGNLSTLLAMAANAFSATRKTTKGVLLTQNLSQSVYCFSAIVLGGYSAAVQNAVSIVRNIAAVAKVRSKIFEWSLVVLGVALGIVFNNQGLIGLLPVVGNLQYTLVIFQLRHNEKALKLSFLISVVFFVVFNLTIYNFVGAAADTVVIITTLISLIRERNEERERKERHHESVAASENHNKA